MSTIETLSGEPGCSVRQETRPLVRAWIWFWYNDVTRLTIVMLGLHIPFVLLAAVFLFGHGEYLRNVAITSYCLVFVWAFLDNDYEQLNRIGLDVYRRPLRNGDKPSSPSSGSPALT